MRVMSGHNSTAPTDNTATPQEENTASAYNWGAPPPASAPAWDFPAKATDDKDDTVAPSDATARNEETIYEGNLTDRQHRQQSQTGGWDRSGGW